MKKYVTPEIEIKEYRLSETIAKCSYVNDESCKGVSGNQQNKCSNDNSSTEPSES